MTARPRGAAARIAWKLLAIALFATFVALGNWQVRRLHWKRQLIRDVAERVHAPPVAPPGVAQWAAADPERWQYLHVRLHGRFLPDARTLVHGTSELGYGYWMLVPMRLDNGTIVLVNRGYIPADLPGTRAYLQTWAPSGEVEITGLLRTSEPDGGFLHPNRPAQNQWYSRDVAAIAAARGLPAARVAPYFVDADAAPGKADGEASWPRSGLTVIQFPNNHLSYLITWYLMALGVLIAAGYVARDEWRQRHAADGQTRPRDAN
ncbi:MAG TPA: SURF1 family protein [Dyella sp.]|nr:SURF1 family protein [Dyella sp.]